MPDQQITHFSEADFAPAPHYTDKDFSEEAQQPQTPNQSWASMGEALSAPPPMVQNFEQGMALQPPTQNAGWWSKQANKAGNILPSVLAGSAGELAGGPAGAAVAASLTRAGQQTANTAITGKADPMSIGLDVAGTGLLQGASSIYKPEIEAAIGSVASGAKKLVSAPFDYLATSKIGGNLAPQAWQYFKDHVQSVLSKIGLGPEDADTMANDLRTTVSNAVTDLETKYRNGVQALQQSKTPIRIDLNKNLGDPILNVAHEAGYLDPARNADSPEAAFFLKNVVGRVNNLKSASPLDIYHFQKDLNGYIEDALRNAPSLAKNLLATKDISRLFIEDHPQLKSIAGMNTAWTSAKTVDALAKSTTNANDLIGTIKRIFNNPQETLQKRAINDVGAQLPEFAQGIDDIRSYLAAQQVGSPFRGIPATGYAAGLGAAGLYGAQKVAENPYYALAAPLMLGLSPRAYAYGLVAGRGLAAQAPKLLPAATMAGRAALQGALTNYTAQPTTPQGMERKIGEITSQVNLPR